MTPQELINFRNEQNQSDTELEFLAFILHGLRQAQKENNELTSQIVATESKEGEKRALESHKLQELGEVQSSLLSFVLDEIRKKDIDLSSVIAGLEAVRMEIASSRQEEKDTEPLQERRNEKVLNALHELFEATKENKPETVDLSPVVEKTEEVSKKTHKLLASLIAEIGKIDVKPEVKIDIPKEVEVKEPKWYNPFSFDTKWLKPIEYAVNAINPKPALARLEELATKILNKQFPEIPKTRDGSRILVEVDRTGGGGSGVINRIGDPINPATEEKQDATNTILDDIKYNNNLYPVGTGTNISVTLTSATTAYSVPDSTPAANYQITLYNGSDTDMYWGYATLTTGGVLLPSGGTVSMKLGADQGLFVYCGSAGKVLSGTYKLIN